MPRSSPTQQRGVEGRAARLREAHLNRIDHRACLVDRQRGLRQVHDASVTGAIRQRGNVVAVFDQRDVAGHFAHRAVDFRVAFVADEHDRVALARESHRGRTRRSERTWSI